MIWIAPSEKDHDNDALEKRLWAGADQLRANSGLTSQQYSALGEKYPLGQRLRHFMQETTNFWDWSVSTFPIR